MNLSDATKILSAAVGGSRSVEQFESGAVRDSQEGKIDFALITPTFKRDLAAMLTDKTRHYGARNWEKGIPTARTFSSLLRHVEALGRGEWMDDESGHPHTVLAAANLMFIHEFHGTEFDTLHEVTGPALRQQAATPAKVDLIYETINHGDPEPPRFSSWKDVDGDTWFYHGDLGAWTFNGDIEEDGWYWNEFPTYLFPMVRVS